MDGLNREINDFDLIIKNGTLVDGTGSKSKAGNIAIKNGVIAAIGNFSGKANEIIDATNLVVTLFSLDNPLASAKYVLFIGRPLLPKNFFNFK